MYNVCANSSLPASAILSLSLQKKKDDEQFCVGGSKQRKTLFGISGASQARFCSFKGLCQISHVDCEIGHVFSQF